MGPGQMVFGSSDTTFSHTLSSFWAKQQHDMFKVGLCLGTALKGHIPPCILLPRDGDGCVISGITEPFHVVMYVTCSYSRKLLTLLPS